MNTHAIPFKGNADIGRLLDDGAKALLRLLDRIDPSYKD